MRARLRAIARRTLAPSSALRSRKGLKLRSSILVERLARPAVSAEPWNFYKHPERGDFLMHPGGGWSLEQVGLVTMGATETSMTRHNPNRGRAATFENPNARRMSAISTPGRWSRRPPSAKAVLRRWIARM